MQGLWVEHRFMKMHCSTWRRLVHFWNIDRTHGKRFQLSRGTNMAENVHSPVLSLLKVNLFKKSSNIFIFRNHFYAKKEIRKSN